MVHLTVPHPDDDLLPTLILELAAGASGRKLLNRTGSGAGNLRVKPAALWETVGRELHIWAQATAILLGFYSHVCPHSLLPVG
jgi:hypothetical protein